MSSKRITLNRNIRALDLQAIAHAFFGQQNFGIITHVLLLDSSPEGGFQTRPYQPETLCYALFAVNALNPKSFSL